MGKYNPPGPALKLCLLYSVTSFTEHSRRLGIFASCGYEDSAGQSIRTAQDFLGDQ